MSLLTDLDIVNAACAMIGEAPLDTLDEEIDAGMAASLLYTAVVEFNLGIHQFSFSKEIRQLSRDDTAAKTAGYDYVYSLPAERIGDPLYCTDEPTNAARRFSAYAIVGTQLHSSATSLYAMIRYRPSPHRWTGPFKMATICAVAANFAIPLTHDRALAEQKMREAYGTPQENFRGGLMRAAIGAEAFTQPGRAQDRDNNPLTNAWQS